MSINDVVLLLPPPTKPSEIPARVDWQTIENSTGALPADYKEFVERFGTGKVDDFITICNPFSANTFVNLASFGDLARRGIEREVASESWSRVGELNPATLKPFGTTDNGDRLAWVARGEPDDWKVMVLSARSTEVDFFEGCMTEFIAAVLRGEVRSNVFPEDFPSEHPQFVSGVAFGTCEPPGTTQGHE